LVIDDGQAINHVKGIELAGTYAVAESKATKLAGLYVGEGVCRGAGWYALINCVVGFVILLCAAVDDGPFRDAGVADLEVENGGDICGCLRTAGRAHAYQLWVLEDGLCIRGAAGIAAGTAIEVGEGFVDLFDFRVEDDFKFFTCNKQYDSEGGAEAEHSQAGGPGGIP